MSNKKFLYSYILISLSIVALIIFANWYIDIYGMFRGKKDRNIYINDRTTKYLLSLKYIPENFDGFIAGPSLSANLNPDDIKEYKIYNASIMGVNISELNFLINNIVDKGHMKFAIVCLGPYLTKDHGKKSASIDPKEYYGAFGSTNLLKTYLFYFIRSYNLVPHKYSPKLFNTSGWNNFESEWTGLFPKYNIEKRYKANEFDSTKIDPVAFEELNNTLQKLRKNNIKIIGYYSPVPYILYQNDKADYDLYEKKIGSLFNNEDVLLNLNDEKYKAINADFNSFIDHGHLSASGLVFVIHILDSTLNKIFKK